MNTKLAQCRLFSPETPPFISTFTLKCFLVHSGETGSNDGSSLKTPQLALESLTTSYLTLCLQPPAKMCCYSNLLQTAVLYFSMHRNVEIKWSQQLRLLPGCCQCHRSMNTCPCWHHKGLYFTIAKGGVITADQTLTRYMNSLFMLFLFLFSTWSVFKCQKKKHPIRPSPIYCYCCTRTS